MINQEKVTLSLVKYNNRPTYGSLYFVIDERVYFR